MLIGITAGIIRAVRISKHLYRFTNNLLQLASGILKVLQCLLLVEQNELPMTYTMRSNSAKFALRHLHKLFSSDKFLLIQKRHIHKESERNTRFLQQRISIMVEVLRNIIYCKCKKIMFFLPIFQTDSFLTL